MLTTIMRWRGAMLCLAALLTVQTAMAASDESRFDRLEPGALVHVLPKTVGAFDAILIGRDADRMVFERLNPDETIAIPLDAVLDIRIVHVHSSGRHPAAWGVFGAAVGFIFVPLLLAIAVAH